MNAKFRWHYISVWRIILLYHLISLSLCQLWYEPRDEKKVSLVVRKPVLGVSNLVRHKPGCTTEDGQRLEMLYLENRGIVLAM